MFHFFLKTKKMSWEILKIIQFISCATAMRKRCGQADRIWVSSRRLKGRMDALVAVAMSTKPRGCWPVEEYVFLDNLFNPFQVCSTNNNVISILFCLLWRFFLMGMQSWHKKCYKCKDCRKHLDSTNCCEAPDKEIYCKRAYIYDLLIFKCIMLIMTSEPRHRTWYNLYKIRRRIYFVWK